MARRRKSIFSAGNIAIAGIAGLGLWYFFGRKKEPQKPVQIPIVSRTVPQVPQTGAVIGTVAVTPSFVDRGRGVPVLNPIVATQGKGVEPAMDINA